MEIIGANIDNALLRIVLGELAIKIPASKIINPGGKHIFNSSRRRHSY
tara:strand:+ start:2310 stop:2453 length:144 start_codon:yes stop_codon:yes gene_type:complete